MNGVLPPPGPLIVLVGAPGSGKSTWARKYFPAGQIVGSDELRITIASTGRHDTQLTIDEHRAINRNVFEARDAIVRGRMRLGRLTVVDATNATAEHREEVAKMRFMYPHGGLAGLAVIFDTPLDVCLKQNSRRRGWRRVPDDDVEAMHAAIERDLPFETTWIPSWFDGAARIRPDGIFHSGMARRYLDQPWLADATPLRFSRTPATTPEGT